MPRTAGNHPLTPEQWKLVTENQGLIFFVLDKARARGFRVDEDDALIAAGDALIRAARCFKPERGFKFSTYATRSIFSALRESRMGRHARRCRRFSDLSEDAERMAASKPAPAQPEPTEHAEQIASIRRVLCLLDDRTQMVIRLRYGLDGIPRMRLSDVGETLGVTRERVRQLQAKGEADLRRILKC